MASTSQLAGPKRYTIPVSLHALLETSALIMPQQLEATLARMDDLCKEVLTSPADTLAGALFADDVWNLHHPISLFRVLKSQNDNNTLENNRRRIKNNDNRTALYGFFCVSGGGGFLCLGPRHCRCCCCCRRRRR